MLLMHLCRRQLSSLMDIDCGASLDRNSNSHSSNLILRPSRSIPLTRLGRPLAFGDLASLAFLSSLLCFVTHSTNKNKNNQTKPINELTMTLCCGCHRPKRSRYDSDLDVSSSSSSSSSRCCVSIDCSVRVKRRTIFLAQRWFWFTLVPCLFVVLQLVVVLSQDGLLLTRKEKRAVLAAGKTVLHRVQTTLHWESDVQQQQQQEQATRAALDPHYCGNGPVGLMALEESRRNATNPHAPIPPHLVLIGRDDLAMTTTTSNSGGSTNRKSNNNNILKTKAPHALYQNVLQTIQMYRPTWNNNNLDELKQKQQPDGETTQQTSSSSSTNSDANTNANKAARLFVMTPTSCARVIYQAHPDLVQFYNHPPTTTTNTTNTNMNQPQQRQQQQQLEQTQIRADLCQLAALYVHGGHYVDYHLQAIQPWLMSQQTEQHEQIRFVAVLQSSDNDDDETNHQGSDSNSANSEERQQETNGKSFLKRRRRTLSNSTNNGNDEESHEPATAAPKAFSPRFLASSPGHPILRLALQDMVQTLNQWQDDDSLNRRRRTTATTTTSSTTTMTQTQQQGLAAGALQRAYDLVTTRCAGSLDDSIQLLSESKLPPQTGTRGNHNDNNDLFFSNVPRQVILKQGGSRAGQGGRNNNNNNKTPSGGGKDCNRVIHDGQRVYFYSHFVGSRVQGTDEGCW